MQTTTDTSRDTPQDTQAWEALSALCDGECPPDQVAAAVAAYADEPQARAAWYAYQHMGQALRAPAQAPASVSFVEGVMARVALEPRPVALPLQTEASPVWAGHPEASNDAVFRWKALAGVAAVLAVAAVAWQGLLPGPVSAPQWAAVPGGGVSAQAPSTPLVQAVHTEQGVVLRDPQLQELLAAHRQYGGMSALQVPAGFLRNATYALPQR